MKIEFCGLYPQMVFYLSLSVFVIIYESPTTLFLIKIFIAIGSCHLGQTHTAET